jgi:hypothetical protein
MSSGGPGDVERLAVRAGPRAVPEGARGALRTGDGPRARGLVRRGLDPGAGRGRGRAAPRRAARPLLRRHAPGRCAPPRAPPPPARALSRCRGAPSHGAGPRRRSTSPPPMRPGLLATWSGVLAAHGLDILSARIVSTADGYALDVFEVRGRAGRPVERTRWRRRPGRPGGRGPRQARRSCPARPAEGREAAPPRAAPGRPPGERRQSGLPALHVVDVRGETASGSCTIWRRRCRRAAGDSPSRRSRRRPTGRSTPSTSPGEGASSRTR